jgi:hypothetical protein
MTRALAIGLTAALSAAAAAPVHADRPASLRAVPGMMRLQHGVALGHGLPFAYTPDDVLRMVEHGDLVAFDGNDDYSVDDAVRWPVGRPELRRFIERLAASYRAACGEPLVVTSLTRAISQQPRNAHALSVHPAGIAADLRISGNADCREWLEAALLDLEAAGVLHAIRERRPPHYHVALFPQPFLEYLPLAPPGSPIAPEAPGADPGVAAAYAVVGAAEQGTAADTAARRGGLRSMFRLLRVLDPRPLLGLA